MRQKCNVCGNKPVKTVKSKHWKTNMIAEFTEGTCGDTVCVAEWNDAMEEGYALARADKEYELSLEESLPNEQ